MTKEQVKQKIQDIVGELKKEIEVPCSDNFDYSDGVESGVNMAIDRLEKWERELECEKGGEDG